MGPTAEAGIYGLESDASLGTVAPEQHLELPLSAEEIERFRGHLSHLREWLLQSIARLETQMRPAGGRMASVDGDDLAWESSVNQRAMADKRLLLNEVTRAIERIDDNTYGRCVAGDALISRSLLEDMPWARFCPKCAVRHG